MTLKALGVALGGHIANQNASFRRFAFRFEEDFGGVFYGGKNGFKVFDNDTFYELPSLSIPRDKAGFVAGASRFSLTKEEYGLRVPDPEKVKKVIDFFKRHKFDFIVGSAGDDHGMQMYLLGEILRQHEKEIGRRVRAYVINKTMDNDLGGDDRLDGPYTEFTNGFHTAVSKGIRRIHEHYLGSWTNESLCVIGVFGRETNWVSNAIAYWTHARVISGELQPNSPGHSLEKVAEVGGALLDENERLYGRRCGILVLAEGTRVEGIEHVSDNDLDEHGHPKLNPEVLAIRTREALKRKYGINCFNSSITYEMRNSAPTKQDICYGEMSADAIIDAIRRGEESVESTFSIRGGVVEAGVAHIIDVSRKRYCAYFPDQLSTSDFRASEAIGRYYKPLFGERKPLKKILPGRPKIAIEI